MKKLLYSLSAVVLLFTTSCSDFLDRAPQDKLSPSTFWQTESDAYLALTGVYKGLDNIYAAGHWTGNQCVMMDAFSDNYFDNFSWEGYQVLQTGNITPTNNGVADSWFSFNDIRTCNEFLEMEGNVAWSDPSVEAQYVAETKTIRAHLLLYRTQFFGDFPLFTKVLSLEEAAAITRAPAAEVKAQVVKDLTEAIPNLADRAGITQGRICKQFAEGLLMRHYLWEGDWANAAKQAESIINYYDSNGMDLTPNYADMFLTDQQYDNEVIFDFSFIANTAREWNYGAIPFVANKAHGGWSSVIPTVDLMDAFECIDGKTIEESPLYNAEKPFLNRDPRLRASIVYPGQQFVGYEDSQSGCYNPMPEILNGNKNDDFWRNAGNATKSGLQLGKYFQSGNINKEGLNHYTLHFKAMRLAEVLLSLAECKIEMGSDLAGAADLIDRVRVRAGMPKVADDVKGSIEKMRDLVHRERRVELNGEALRRFDMVRWHVDGNGNWVTSGGTPYIVWKFSKAFSIEHLEGDILNEKDANGDWVAHVTGRTGSKPEDDCAFNVKNFQSFSEKNVLWPVTQEIIDVNPNIKQTVGY